MGLDIMLHFCENLEKEVALMEEAKAFSEQLWESVSYTEATEATKDEKRKLATAKCVELGLDEWGGSLRFTSVEHDSETYPTHLFKVGYFRSSYNDGGINSVLTRVGVLDLYDIFQPGDGDYYVIPDWVACKGRVEQAIEEYLTHLHSPLAHLDVMSVYPATKQMFDKPIDALKHFIEKNKGYNAARRTFLEVYPSSQSRNLYYAIVSKEVPENVEDDWYLKALYIVKETITYVLAQPDPDNYFLCWSS